MQSEQELVTRVIAGDPAAEEEFFRIYRPRLYRASMYFLGSNDSEADDIVQETFIIALPKLKDYVFNAPIFAWLRQICLRLCYARMRTRKRHLMSAEEDLELLMRRHAVEKIQREDESVERDQRLGLLHELKKKLNPDFREIIEMRNVQGMSYTLIARTLKIPIGTVMSRLSRAREQIKKLALSEAEEGTASPLS
jgi:RNA polymerase sigma-70 factor (ECF subfamily)